MEPQQIEVQVVIPQGATGRGTCTRAEVVETVLESMADEAGGYTVIEDARGGWNSDSGLVDEPVDVLTCTLDTRTPLKARAFARELASTVDYCTDEESVFYKCVPVWAGSTGD